MTFCASWERQTWVWTHLPGVDWSWTQCHCRSCCRHPRHIRLGSVCFDFHSTNICSSVCCLRLPNDHRQQPVTEPKPMSLPLNHHPRLKPFNARNLKELYEKVLLKASWAQLVTFCASWERQTWVWTHLPGVDWSWTQCHCRSCCRHPRHIRLGSVCFDFHSTNICSSVCCLRLPNDHRQQPVTEPKPMSLPLNHLP